MTTLNFNEVFELFARRKVGGGPKTTPHDEMTWHGDLGRGPLVLTTRVRLIDPHESFYTNANHRLRDSKVGDAGHWIDARVAGPATEEDLELVRELAQAVDARPVIVRRAAK